MRRILALETATEICGVALMEGSKIVDVIEESIPRQHAQKLPLFVEQLLTNSQWTIKDLDGIALSIGPGSFTGLRVGLSFAKGLAYSHGLPLIPISTLEGLVTASNTEEKQLVTLLYSHGNQIYIQKWEKDSDRWEAVNQARIESMDSWLKGRDGTVPVVYWFGGKELPTPSNGLCVQPTVRSIGALAARDFETRHISDAFELTPEYIATFKLH